MANEDPRARLKRWIKTGQARLHPLTLPQRELWETSPVPPGDPANHVCSFFEIQGPITFEHCQGAVARVVERQEALRTSFLPGKDRPLQIVRSTGETVLRYRELTEEEARPESIEEIMLEGFAKPFHFMREPLYRLDMLRRGEDDFVLALTMHHAISDGWTLGAVVEDLCTAYILELQDTGEIDLGKIGENSGIRQSLPELRTSYTEWGAAERARWTPAAIEEHAAYWKDRLAGSRRLLDAAASGGDKTGRLEKWVTELPTDLSTAVRSLARSTGTTLFNTLLAAFQLALHRWTGVDDVIVGTPVANRRDAGVKETVGYFAGVVPLRGYVDPGRAFSDHVKEVQEHTMDAFAHEIPFAELASLLGESSSPDRHAIFDTRFALQNHPIPDIELPGISTRLRTRSTGTVRFDLGCELTEDDDKFEVVWLFRPSVVPRGDLEELDQLYRQV
ncbi:MAG: hypothetical protein ACI9MB_001124, partial [Verrucomicrobiales bacterium]